jgi:predicted transcriptional regulator
MAQKSKIREVTIVDKGGTFNTFFRKLTGEGGDYDFEGLAALRRLLSNERARMLHVIKTKRPKSLYELSRLLARDFKSVASDIKLLQRFALVEMAAEKTGKRQRLRPTLAADTLTIHVRLSS